MSTAYWLNEQNTIVDVNLEWDDFATANDGQSVCASSVVNKPLKHFITGEPTLMWMDVLLSNARLMNKTITRCYRCDSPSEKREMEMTITPEQNGVLCLRHQVLNVIPLTPPITFRQSREQSPVYNRCSVCNSVEAWGEWREPELAIQASEQEKTCVPVDYKVCPQCVDQLQVTA